MKRSKLFSTKQYRTVQEAIKRFLNEQERFLFGSALNSPRAVGDAVQEVLSEHFQSMLGTEICSKYSANFARRAMADLAFEDREKFYYVVDVKTHRLSTSFNMPNLTSAERLSRFYEDDSNYFVVLMVAYDVVNDQAVFKNVSFVPIEFFEWGCLTIGALGWGQIQIANSNRISIKPFYSRKAWMIEFCDTMLEFYPKELSKIRTRIDRFEKLRSEWAKRLD